MSDIIGLPMWTVGCVIRVGVSMPQSHNFSSLSDLGRRAQWHRYIVPNVPRELWTIDGVCPTKDLLEEEVLAVTKVKPVRIALSKHFKEGEVNQIWVVVLPVKVKPGFRLFDSKPARGVKEKVMVV